MNRVTDFATSKGYVIGALTLGQTMELARDLSLPVSEVVIAEAAADGERGSDVLDAVEEAFRHNLEAVQEGLSGGESFLLGRSPSELAKNDFSSRLLEDDFVNKALVYTLAAQVGNHLIGLEPCAGTGDACPYTGVFKAMTEEYGRERALRSAAVMLKVGTVFREGKCTTGCNMEGFGAGAAATAAALVELRGGSASDMERAVVLAISPTIATPCTPRVMVPGLCATHICGAILIGNVAANLAIHTGIPVNVPVDVMVAMTTDVHPVSAAHVVPIVNEYMRPFFKTRDDVDSYVDQDLKGRERAAAEAAVARARETANSLARRANPITRPFGQAVVGGSSQAVGSPTNAARIAHHLAKGEVQKVRIELYPELFARRAINVPGILMGAVYGAHTSDAEAYREVMGRVLAEAVRVEVTEADEPQLQRITIEASERSSMVDSLNRGGGRLVLRDAAPSRDDALGVASRLGIVVVE